MNDDNTINIEGIDQGTLLAALHNNTQPLGMGMLHARPPMTAEEARIELASMEPFQGCYRFDYYHGRPLKVSFDDKNLRGVRLYDRDAGQGACQMAVDEARAKSVSK